MMDFSLGKRALALGLTVVSFFVSLTAHGMGATPGQFQVGPSGAATYSIPIDVPPGTGGMAPSLSLVYNSQSGNGPFGMGFSLDGLAIVYRCPKTYAQDNEKGGVTMTTGDRLCLNGQRLIPTDSDNTDAGYWSATEYRTEIASFSKIIANSPSDQGPSSFTVYTKSGQIMTFGGTDDSRIEELAAIGTNIRLWTISKIEDTVGNYLAVTYTEDNNHGQFHPLRIDYTGNDAAGLVPQRSVRFVDAIRTDVPTLYAAGSPIEDDSRITNIQTYVGATLVKDYQLTYEYSGATGRSRLTTVTECGDAAGTTCHPPTVVNWFDGFVNASNGSRFQNVTQQQNLNISDYKTGDFNGDGLTDYVYTDVPQNYPDDYDYIEMNVQLSNGDGTFSLKQLVHTYTNGSADPQRLFYITGDYNGDGRSDILLDEEYYDPDEETYYYGWTLYVSNGNGTFTDQGFAIDGKNGVKVYGVEQLDYNGDGIEDIFVEYNDLFNSEGSGTPEWVLYRGNGDSSFTQISSPRFSGYTISGCSGDFNGDGKTDVCYRIGNGYRFYQSNGNGTFTLTTTLTIVDALDGYNSAYVADFNGDGNADFVMPEKSNWMVFLSKGDGTFNNTPTFAISDKYRAQLPIDYNGDGYIDLLLNNASGVSTYNGIGAGWAQFKGAGDGTFTYDGKFTNSFQWNSPITGEFNGDGKTDFIINVSSGRWDHYLSKNAGEHSPDLVTKVTDGLGAEIDITYKPLTDSTVYTKGTGAAYPELDLIAPMYVVSDTSASNGIGGTNTTSYAYEGMKVNMLGRGSLGFAKMTVTDGTSGIYTVTEYNQAFPKAGTARASRTYRSNGNIIKEVTSTYQSTVISELGGDRYFVYSDSSTEKTYELGAPATAITTVDTTTVYDSYGNPTLITVDSNDDYVKVTGNVYLAPDLNKWFLDRLIYTKVISFKPDGTSNYRESAFLYYPDTGLLQAEVIEPNRKELSLITFYTYDEYGNKTIVSVLSDEANQTASKIATRYTVTTYDDIYHTFPETITNALGHFESRTYDAQWGKQLSLMGPNNLTTLWEFDGLGRPTKETRADGTSTSTTYTNCSSGCTYGSPFFITTTSTGKAPVTTYYDMLGREIATKTNGFSGAAVYKFTEYDDRGRARRVSRNTFTADPASLTASFWASSQYDDLGRITIATSPDGSSSTTSYNGLTTSVTNALNQTTTQTHNSQGQLIRSTDADLTYTDYVYDAFGNLTKTTVDVNGKAVSTQMSYDIRGRKTSMIDPDMGFWQYEYNVLGELAKQTDAKGQFVVMVYDVLGRMTARAELEGYTSWEYDTATKGIGKLTTVTSARGDTRSHTYDDLGRPSTTTINVSGVPYVMTTGYDAEGRVETTTYPTTLATKNFYNINGYLEKVVNNADGSLYWQTNTANAAGQVTQVQYGNGLVTNRIYDDTTGRIYSIDTGSGGSVQDLIYDFDVLGNLERRRDTNLVLDENFTYDNLNRLKTAGGTGYSFTYDYDAIGNITNKPDVGIYSYGVRNDGATGADPEHKAGPHAVIGVAGIKNATYTYDANGNMLSGDGRTLTYTSFNKPQTISKDGTDVAFIYDADRNRLAKAAGGKTTVYIGKAMEISNDGSTIEYKHYINGGMAVVTLRSNSNNDIRYLHKDHLGSTDVITDEVGAVIERLSFDAWGRQRAIPWGGSLFTVLNSSITSRGFTGHEMDNEIGLVNMNARMYDPVLGRFLQADTIVQQSGDGQTFNRYTYVKNNPLSLTDPSGYFFKSLFKGIKKLFKGIKKFIQKYGSIISIALNFIPGFQGWGNAFLRGFALGFLGSGGSLKGGVIGGITGAMFGQIPELKLGDYGNYFAHGVVGGISAELQGGKFGRGFLSQAFSKGVTIGLHNPIFTKLGKIGKGIIAVVAGGTARVLGGGKFKNGAISAAYGYLFNELRPEKWEAIRNPRATRIYYEDGEYTYKKVLDVNATDVTGAGKIIKYFVKVFNLLDVTVEEGTRFYQFGTEYDVVYETRLIRRNENGFITYQSHVLSTENVLNSDGSIRTRKVPLQNDGFHRETKYRLCAAESNFCTN